MQEAPKRGAQHEALEVFVGCWRAEGTAYGGPRPTEADPKAAGVPWTSTHEARWHTGKFFLIQDERAVVGEPFDTLTVMGVEGGALFARTFENHGYQRHYEVTVAGRVWTFTGATERARIEFAADGNTQTITWEWKPGERWLPLCDRVARRVASHEG